MPSFDASAVVEALDWDFTGKLPGGKRVPGWPKELHSAKGTITEPTDRAIGDFLDGLKKLFTEQQGIASLPPDATAAQMLDAMTGLTGEAFIKMMGETAGLFSDLCGGSPTSAQLLALPMRARVQFYGWIQQEVVNPEAGTGDGQAVVRSLPTAHAG